MENNGLLPKIILMLVISVVASMSVPAQRTRINRVRPPMNTEQYAKEAARTIDVKMSEIAGLSDEQFLKLRKASLSRLEKSKKAKAGLDKEEKRWEKAQNDYLEKERKAVDEYDAELRKIMTPEQYEKCMEWYERNYSGDSVSSCKKLDNDSLQKTDEGNNENETPGFGPIVKGKQPTILTHPDIR